MDEVGSKILIIDDEEEVLEYCMQILEDSPYYVATAMNGLFGLELVREFRPDVVFVDLKMTGSSGFETLKKIFNFDPSIVTIAISGFATVDSAVEAIKTGAYDFLPKPFTPDQFRFLTRRGLERRELVQETIALRREREMLRDHFAAIVSHELKAPLGAVQQNLFALEHELADQLAEEQSDRLKRMKGSIDNLVKLIHTWLRVISTDIHVLQENFRPTILSEVISRAIESVETHAIRKSIEIITILDDDLEPIQADEVTLGEAIVNIVSNAIKYSRIESKIRIETKAEGDEILISIADRGVGISEEDLPFVFRDFYIASSAPAAERGSGLGLAITRRIIEAHGGSISVESALEKGSTFMIRLPVMGTEVYVNNTESAGILTSAV